MNAILAFCAEHWGWLVILGILIFYAVAIVLCEKYAPEGDRKEWWKDYGP